MKPDEDAAIAYAQKVIKLAHATTKSEDYEEAFDLLLFSAIVALHEKMHTGQPMCCTATINAVVVKATRLATLSAFAELQGGVDLPRAVDKAHSH